MFGAIWNEKGKSCKITSEDVSASNRIAKMNEFENLSKSDRRLALVEVKKIREKPGHNLRSSTHIIHQMTLGEFFWNHTYHEYLRRVESNRRTCEKRKQNKVASAKNKKRSKPTQ